MGFTSWKHTISVSARISLPRSLEQESIRQSVNVFLCICASMHIYIVHNRYLLCASVCDTLGRLR